MHNKAALLITCGVGYGHLAATQNIQESLQSQDPSLKIIRLDTRDYFPALVGRLSDQWDNFMRKGHFSISQVVEFQGLYELFYARFLSKKLKQTLATLFAEHHITAVYDMQPVLTATLYQGIAQACRGRSIIYHKILTDLPTARNQSYFTGLRQIKHAPNLHLKVHAPEPLLKANQTPEAFWQKHCQLSLTHIDTVYALPINQRYLQAPSTNGLHIKVNPEWQLQLPLPPDAYVTTLMMGSQGVNVIYDYAVRYLEQLQQQSTTRPHYFFIACSKNQALYDALRDLLINHPVLQNSPHRIIPLTMQTMDDLASLMWRSDQVIIRSGGISSLEQFAVSRARHNHPQKLWIHSGYKGTNPAALLKHTYAWERGNAEYLMHTCQARMTAPQLIDFFG